MKRRMKDSRGRAVWKHGHGSKTNISQGFRSNARSPLPKKLPLTTARPQTVSQANTALLPYLSFTHMHAYRRADKRNGKGKGARVCVWVRRWGRCCWPAAALWDSYLGSKFELILFNIVLSNHTNTKRTHMHTLVQLDRVKQGWVGAMRLNAFPVMHHRQDPGLLPLHYWLSLHLCTCVWVLHPLPPFPIFLLFTTMLRGDMSVNVVERDLNHILVMRYEPVWNF